MSHRHVPFTECLYVLTCSQTRRLLRHLLPQQLLWRLGHPLPPRPLLRLLRRLLPPLRLSSKVFAIAIYDLRCALKVRSNAVRYLVPTLTIRPLSTLVLASATSPSISDTSKLA
jgi:hypothetical protein